MDLRHRLQTELKDSLINKDKIKTATIRLILAALKDRDIDARSKGNDEGIDEISILQILQSMIKQRRESIVIYTKGDRKDLADQEAKEIKVIETFLPQQMDAAEIKRAAQESIQDIAAESLRDMGKVMTQLREKYAGQMDFSKASQIVKDLLT
tara:strand:+ start:6998 stop:7456 length:459 start_codon:yes stop_codon:yes gene_type:complete